MLKTLNLFDITKPNIKPFYTTSNTEGYIYHDEENFYKLYRTNKSYLLERKELKTNMLDGYSLDNVVLPKGKIKLNKKFRGIYTDYVKDSYPLYDFKCVNNKANDFFMILDQASNTLKKIHEAQIVVSDLSFDNIIFDKNKNHYFIDFDSCSLNNVPGDKVPYITNRFVLSRCASYEIDYNYDRISFYLSLLYFIFNKEVHELSIKEYDEVSEKIKTLKNIRKLFIKLKETELKIPEVPYINDYIEKETHIFTR